MAKIKTSFACQNCGTQFSKWQGQCLACQHWNSIVEEVAPKAAHPRSSGFSGVDSRVTKLADVTVQTQPRLDTGSAEFNHVLGGGLVCGSVVLIGGDPGVGKSTLLIQILCQLAINYSALYISGEESLQQIAMRAQRLGLPQDQLSLLTETSVERMLALAEKIKPQVLVIDSIQTCYTEALTAAPGGVGQVRESAAKLVQFAKQKGIALFLVGHVTKEGAFAAYHQAWFLVCSL